MIARCFAAGLVAGLLAGSAFAEEPKGPVHITSRGASVDAGEEREDHAEAVSDAREGLADAKQGLKDAEQGLEDMSRDLAAMEAGDFSHTMTIEDDKVVKCGDPAKYPGCTPYTDAEKAEMVASMRRDLENGRVDLENAKRDLAAAEGSLAELEGR